MQAFQLKALRNKLLALANFRPQRLIAEAQ
jgi:hypothetical protein